MAMARAISTSTMLGGSNRANFRLSRQQELPRRVMELSILSWFSVPGKIYDIQFTEDLTGTRKTFDLRFSATSGNST